MYSIVSPAASPDFKAIEEIFPKRRMKLGQRQTRVRLSCVGLALNLVGYLPCLKHNVALDHSHWLPLKTFLKRPLTLDIESGTSAIPGTGNRLRGGVGASPVNYMLWCRGICAAPLCSVRVIICDSRCTWRASSAVNDPLLEIYA